MELKDDPPPARWSEPRAAHDRFRPGLSPYLHYYYDLRTERGDAPPREPHGPDDGADLPGQLERALRDLVRRTFE